MKKNGTNNISPFYRSYKKNTFFIFQLSFLFLLSILGFSTYNLAFAKTTTNPPPNLNVSKKSEKLKFQLNDTDTHISSLDNSIIITTPLLGWSTAGINFQKLSKQAFSGGFVPKHYNWSNAPVVMYVKSVERNDRDLNTFIQQDLNDLQEATETSLPGFTLKGIDYTVKQIIPQKYDPYVIAYGAYEKHFLLFIISGKHVQLLNDHLNDLQNLIKNTTYAYFLNNKMLNHKTIYCYKTQNNEEFEFTIDPKSTNTSTHIKDLKSNQLNP